MVSLYFLLLVIFSLDWGKTCKPVNYKYTQFKNKLRYDYGCKKGCFGYANDTTGAVDLHGIKFDGDHDVQDKCVECKTITKDFVTYYVDADVYPSTTTHATTDEDVEKVCNGKGLSVEVTDTYATYNRSVSLRFTRGTCFWNSKKKTCGAGSCPRQAQLATCRSWKNGKCEKVNFDECSANNVDFPNNNYVYETSTSTSGSLGCGGQYYRPSSTYVSCNNITSFYYEAGFDTTNGCDVFKKFTADQQAECKYKCENSYDYSYNTYEYTKAQRKYCHKVLGCLYSGENSCSYLAVWAFVLVLVIVILVVLAIIALVCFLVFKLCFGNKTKVDPVADKATSAPIEDKPVSASPATQAPPPEVGPFVVIKVAKQESQTKKVESAVWNQSIEIPGMGEEDEDVTFELHDNSGALLGSAILRIVDYVDARKRATINLKDGEAAVIGTLEADIEIKVEKEPEVKITGVFLVDKFTKV